MTTQHPGRFVLAFGASALLLLSGCYGKSIAALEVRAARDEDRLDQLDRSQKDLAATVEQLQRKVSEQVELVRAGRAASAERMGEIEKQLQIVAQRVDESGDLVSDIKDSMRYNMSRPAAVDSGAAASAPVTPRSLYDAAYQDLTRGNHGLAILERNGQHPVVPSPTRTFDRLPESLKPFACKEGKSNHVRSNP